MRSTLALALLLLPHAAAHAEALQAWSEPAAADQDGEEEDDNPFHIGRWEVTLGLLAGSQTVGPIRGPAVGPHLDAGYNVGKLLLYGEYDFLVIGENQEYVEDPVRGQMHRLGGMGRYALGEIGGGDTVPLQGQLWVEGGLGRELIRWDKGGKLGRNDVAFGVGGELNVMARRRTRPSVFSIHYAFRMSVAREPSSSRVEMATCGGPCDAPTKPSPWDLGLFFNVGLSWGR
jgi:hypothetical protein